MSPIDYICIASAILVPAVIIGCALLFTEEDYDAAGIHLGNDPVPMDLAKIYKDPMGFEPHGSRDTFVPPPMKPGDLSTDAFIHSLADIVSSRSYPLPAQAHEIFDRALAMLVNARDLLDSCYEIIPDPIDADCDNIDDIHNRISNWLVRGHQD